MENQFENMRNKMKAAGIFLGLVFLFSCGKKLPDGILNKETMQAVYWDMMRADEMVNYNATADTSYNRIENQEAYYQAILRMHNITKETFRKSKEYYESHPELLKIILDSVYAKGERLQNLPDVEPEPAPLPSTDTIENILKPVDSVRGRDRLLIQDGN